MKEITTKFTSMCDVYALLLEEILRSFKKVGGSIITVHLEDSGYQTHLSHSHLPPHLLSTFRGRGEVEPLSQTTDTMRFSHRLEVSFFLISSGDQRSSCSDTN